MLPLLVVVIKYFYITRYLCGKSVIRAIRDIKYLIGITIQKRKNWKLVEKL